MRFLDLRDTDVKGTIVDSTWNCLPVARQDEYSVTLLDITGAGTTQNIYYSMAVAAAVEAEVPLICLNGYKYKISL